jgi:hypothetical protein
LSVLKIAVVPFTGYIKVMLPESTGSSGTISIMNILGQEMNRAAAEPGQNTIRMDISELPAGYYVAKYSANNKIWSKSDIM